MPQERLPVRKIKEILRLDALGLSQRQIALSCSVGQATVSEYLKAAETAGLKWSDVADWDEDRLRQAIALPREAPTPRKQSPEPDYAAVGSRNSSNTVITPWNMEFPLPSVSSSSTGIHNLRPEQELHKHTEHPRDHDQLPSA